MKYFIKIFDVYELEVSKEKYIQIEEFCGFFSKNEGEPATLDFGFLKNGLNIKGRQEEDLLKGE